MLYKDGEASRMYGSSPLFGCDFGVVREGVVKVNDVIYIKHIDNDHV